MKRIKYLLFSIFVLFVGFGISNAASLSVSANKTNVIVGNTVTVTVSASGAAGWEYCLSYDADMFSLSSTTSDTGGSCVKTGSTLSGFSKVTYTLKAKKSGTSTVSLKDYAMYDDNGSNVSVSVGSVKITAKTQAEIEASYSTNADLKALSVNNYEISPAFNKNTTEYTLEVENEVDKITISASKADGSASVSGAGEKELLEGSNKFDIVVTAEKGNKKTYTITVTRKELNPINRTINGKEYSVVRKAENIEAPSYYTLDKATIDGEEVPAYKSEITGYTLLAVKDEDGNVSFFRYDGNELSSYIQLSTEIFTFIVEEAPEKLEGFDKEVSLTIGEQNLIAYVNKEDSDFVVVYGMNASTGEKGWYVYDKVEKTFQRYNTDMTPEEKGLMDNMYFILSIAFAGISALAIILLIVLMSKNSKLRKNNEKLVEILENKKEKREQKLDAKFDSFSDRDEEERKKLEQTIHLDATEEIKTLEEIEAERESQEKEKIKKEVAKLAEENDLDNAMNEAYDNETEILEEINSRALEKEQEESVSKRELRRLEKQRKQEEKEEIKQMQDDFFSTSEINEEDIEKTEEVETVKDTGQNNRQYYGKKHKKKRK